MTAIPVSASRVSTVSPVRQHARQWAARDQSEHLLLRGLGQQPAHLLKRRAAPPAGVRVNREIDPGAGDGRVGHPERHACLDRQVLEVRRPRVEQQRQLSVVDRHLRQHRRQRPEEERQPRPLMRRLPPPQVPDVHGRVAAQVPGQWIPLDVSHRGSLSSFIVSSTIKHGDHSRQTDD
jgi:hypothetical protein